jgi:hypothetical protein
LEQFDHLHSHHQRDGDEIGHKEPPGAGRYPKITDRDRFRELMVRIFEDGVKQRANEGYHYLVDEDLYD